MAVTVNAGRTFLISDDAGILPAASMAFTAPTFYVNGYNSIFDCNAIARLGSRGWT